MLQIGCIILVLFFSLIFVSINKIEKDEPIRKMPPEFESDDYEYDKSVVVNKSQNPVIVWWSPGIRFISENIFCGKDIICDVFHARNKYQPVNVEAYLFYATTTLLNFLPLPRQPNKVIWGLFHEESPRNLIEMSHGRILSLFNYSATFSRYSDVPFPLQHLDDISSITSRKYFKETAEKNLLLTNMSSILYMQTDCATFTERDIYVEKLMELIEIDSYGACLKNKMLPRHLTENYLMKLHLDENLRFLARYKFVIAIENGVCDDYITEKLWLAIKVGTVPIYFGSPTIRDWLPNQKSAILLEDFPTPKLMSEHIKKLLRDDNLYEEYLEHKTKGIIRNNRIAYELRVRPYQNFIGAMVNEFECFICKKLYNKEKGVNIVPKSHYNCSQPVSALQLGINPYNPFAYGWHMTKKKVDDMVDKIENGATSL